MTVGYVRGASTNSGGSSVSSKQTSYASNDEGDFLVGNFAWDDPSDTISITGVTDTAGNTWVKSSVKRYGGPSLGISAQQWHVIGCVDSPGTNTVTVTLSNSTTHVINSLVEMNSDFGYWGADLDPAINSQFATGNDNNPGPLGADPQDSIAFWVSFCICTAGVTVNGVSGDGFTERQPSSPTNYLVSTAETTAQLDKECEQSLSSSTRYLFLNTSYIGTGSGGVYMWTGSIWEFIGADWWEWNGSSWTVPFGVHMWNGFQWTDVSF